jgi:hypothetical protein
VSELPDLDRHLNELELRIMRPAARSSRQELEELIVEDFVEFGSSGAVYDRATVVSALVLEQPVAWAISDFKVKLLSPDVALVTYVATMAGRGSSLRCSIWKRSDGRWRMAFHQGTKMKD